MARQVTPPQAPGARSVDHGSEREEVLKVPSAPFDQGELKTCTANGLGKVLVDSTLHRYQRVIKETENCAVLANINGFQAIWPDKVRRVGTQTVPPR